MTGTNIRFAKAGDYGQWLPLWNGYNRFYGRFDATALPEEITQATWRRFAVPNEPVHALVAERDGRLVGLAHYLFHRAGNGALQRRRRTIRLSGLSQAALTAERFIQI